MCRGDVTNHLCQECIRTAARKISQVCPNALPEKYLPSLLSSLFLTHCLFLFFLFSLCFYFAVSATLRNGFKCQARIKIKSLFTLSIRSPS
ncbi:hypothetical protein VIGAN_08009700 [Vigna angularis var. angularis]|uniref:Gnk2-homologous domain-containing protein n=1 Tax=Vigna angularis var. angularis TaxID=157739 RepID=A0A0S3SL43_PHAAN|nr:hypothetical protein VIGAN_08009700 [Vigna angularis var. angularis]